MKIHLVEGRTVWGIPERNFYLTLSGPEADLEWPDLSPAQKRMVLMGIRLGAIASDVPTKTLTEEMVGVKPAAPSPVLQKTFLLQEDGTAVADRTRLANTGQAKTLLLQGAKKLREQISVCNDIKLLRDMLEEEKEGKQRKSVLGWLHDRKLRLETQLSKALGKAVDSQDIRVPLVGHDRRFGYDTMVEETTERTIEIHHE